MEYTAETIKCKPIDTQRIEKELAEQQNKPDTLFNVRSKLAIVYAPKMAIIDDEFIGWDITPSDEIELDVWTETKDKDGRVCGSCFPSGKITYKNLTDLGEYLLPEVTLAEFSKNRRGYNSRIRGNEAQWMRHFNS